MMPRPPTMRPIQRWPTAADAIRRIARNRVSLRATVSTLRGNIARAAWAGLARMGPRRRTHHNILGVFSQFVLREGNCE